MTDEMRLLLGTDDLEPPPISLAAGRLTADLAHGNLRSIRYDGSEVLRAIAYVVRDRDWGTYEPAVSDMAVEQGDDAFVVRYTARCVAEDDAVLTYRVHIHGSAGGRLVFEAIAEPTGDFETNRCGFCVLHPIRGLAGAPVTVERVDGVRVETNFPELIEPWQPFKNIRAITHEVRTGVRAECRMEGDAFEMEDQRNWSDASYKTYVRPLELPWPYKLASGVPAVQRVGLHVSDIGGAPAVARKIEDPIRIELGKYGSKLPTIGLVIYPEDAGAALSKLEQLAELGPQGLLLHFDPGAGHDLPELRTFASLLAAYPVEATLECVMECHRDLDVELGHVADLVDQAGLGLAAITVSPAADRLSTPPGGMWPDVPAPEDIYAAARRAFPNVRLGGGMLSYFTELNRKRVPSRLLDFVTHCTCPIVHAADDLSVMQSLESLPFIAASTQAIFGSTPYRIGPSTIAMRQNPYGGSTKDNPSRRRIPMANRDPRHAGLFGAAWTIGYAASVAAAGLEQLTPSGFAGSFGLFAEKGEGVPEGRLRPVFHSVRGLARMAGLTHAITSTGDDARVQVLAGRAPDNRLVAWFANLTAGEVEVDISALGGRQHGSVAMLDSHTAIQASTGTLPQVRLQSNLLRLGPYAAAMTS